ncbi:MAG TPA: DUF4388 domain-containing protein [Acidimicrobiales bacterium]
MSLEGSLETVALPEVLQLLSDTSKTGELLVRGDRGDGRLWFGQGRLSGFQVAGTDQAADALFDLLRNREGRFEFEADAERPEDAHQVDDEDGEVRPVLEVAQARLAEWTEIIAVVPSLEHVVRLADEAPRARLHLDAAQWALIVAIGEGRPVQEILGRGSLPEFDGCKSLKTLVDTGLATVVEPVVAIVEDPVADVAEVVEEVPEVEDPVAEESEVPVAFEAAPSAEVTDVPAYETYEAPLDPHEYVFSASTATEPTYTEETGEELAPWSVALDDSPANGSDDTDYVPQPVPYPETHDDAEASESHDARAALEALIAEIPADDQESETPHELPDGLADRGPWTSNELAHMSTWHEEEQHQETTSWGSFEVTSSHAPYDVEAPEVASAAGHDAAAHDYEAVDSESVDESDEEEEAEHKPEQVNRGLLLKFLSSVRS